MNILELQNCVESQVRNILCFELDVTDYIDIAVKRTILCLRRASNKYLLGEGENELPFSVYNSTHYCTFLYHLSRVAFEKDGTGINAEKFYYLNKILNAVDLFYEIELPHIWGVEHPLGSIMGRAQYSDYFFFYQRCTVGGNEGKYPTIGEYVTMYSDSKILGDAVIGDNVIISANTYIKEENIPSNSIVFGQSPHLVIKAKTEQEIKMRLTKAAIWI